EALPTGCPRGCRFDQADARPGVGERPRHPGAPHTAIDVFIPMRRSEKGRSGRRVEDYNFAATLEEVPKMARFVVNGKPVQVDVEPNTPLLWVLREQVGLTGTKYGCGVAQCGACTVHVDGQATRACVLPVSSVEGKRITTI